MPFLSQISKNLHQDLHQENSNSLLPSSDAKSHATQLFTDETPNYERATLIWESLYNKGIALSSTEKLALLLGELLRGSYHDVVTYYEKFDAQFIQHPQTFIVCGQMFLALTNTLRGSKLISSEKKSFEKQSQEIFAAIETNLLSATPDEQKKSWAYLITLGEIQYRQNKLDEALSTVKNLLENPSLSDTNRFSAELLLGKIYLEKIKQGHDEFRESLDKLANHLVETDPCPKTIRAKDSKTNEEKNYDTNNPTLYSFLLEKDLHASKSNLIETSEMRELAIKARRILTHDNNLPRFNPAYDDFHLQETEKERLIAINNICVNLILLQQKQDELSALVSRLDSGHKKSTEKQRRALSDLTHLNTILRGQLIPLLNGKPEAETAFIKALDLKVLADNKSPLVERDFRHILLKILKSMLRLGLTKNANRKVMGYLTKKHAFFNALEIKDELKATAVSMQHVQRSHKLK